jgi:hypothetical protein
MQLGKLNASEQFTNRDLSKAELLFSKSYKLEKKMG